VGAARGAVRRAGRVRGSASARRALARRRARAARRAAARGDRRRRHAPGAAGPGGQGDRSGPGDRCRGAGMTTIVFVGPTLPADEVRARLPGAIVRPPAAVGDILRARAKRIVLIDGYFEGMAAVWHKEILVALER